MNEYQIENRDRAREERATAEEVLRADMRLYLQVFEQLEGDALEDKLDEIMESRK